MFVKSLTRGALTPAIAALLAACSFQTVSTVRANESATSYFERIATFPVYLNTDIDNETVSEIVAATEDGMTLAYTDSSLGAIGFVDISNPSMPMRDGVVYLEGEPTSVAILGNYALAAVVTDDSFTSPKGQLEVIDIAKRQVVAKLDLGGQPDAISISPDGKYAAVVIENERDEDLGDGRPGQPGNPPGKIIIVHTNGKKPKNWPTREISLLGVSDKFPNDPEPEFVDINSDNIAAISMQEDNHIVLMRLPSGKIINDFSAGKVDLFDIDATEEDLINQVESLFGLEREPDALTWIGNDLVATADEGDLDGGSRGFTFFNLDGSVAFTSGNNDDQMTAMIGHYPEDRSGNKGNEPEGIEYGVFGDDRLVFVGSERSSVISVYRLDENNMPQFVQVLPTSIGPEGLLALPARNLFVVASEEDNRGDKFRSSISIYSRTASSPDYPTIASEARPDGTPIPWAALSALAADPTDANKAWTVYDSFFKKSRIFEMDLSGAPAHIVSEIVIKDDNGVLADLLDTLVDNETYPDFKVEDLINPDKSVNLDPEGLARRSDGGFWLASEGSGTVGDEESRPITSRNFILKISDAGVIEEAVTLPEDTNARQRRFGFEGVAAVGSGDDEVVYVCVQREWGVEAPENGRDPAGYARIGRYEVGTGDWTFFYYPLDPRESANGGWVGLSEIVALSDEAFLVLERDNQGGADAAIKRIYAFTTDGVTPMAEAPLGDDPTFPVLDKFLVKDIMGELAAPKGAIIEKVEGLAVLANGEMIIVTDNDGVDDSSGETQLINLGLLDL